MKYFETAFKITRSQWKLIVSSSGGKKYTMRSKVTNENTWETKWATESSQSGKSVRRTAKRTVSSGLKLSKPTRGNTARERTLRRLESNERERMRMHSLNDAFQVRKKYYCLTYHILI